MLDPLFSEAWIHAPGGHRVLGRQLHPLCALDLLALEAINSPFLVDGARAEASDLVLAIWILSNDHPRDCTVGRLELDAAGKVWLESIAQPIDLASECPKVVIYFEDYWSLPEMMRTIADNPLTPYGAPWMLRHVETVCRRLHVPLYEAWTMGIGQLIWHCCSIEESENEESRIVGPAMRDRLAAAKDSYKVTDRINGETDDQFAARLGVPVASLRAMLASHKRKAR